MSGENRSAVSVSEQPQDGETVGDGALETGARLVRASGVAAEIARAEREQGALTRDACLDALNSALKAAEGNVSGDEARDLKAMGDTLCAVTLDFETQQR
jgi:hypothetical protein